MLTLLRPLHPLATRLGLALALVTSLLTTPVTHAALTANADGTVTDSTTSLVWDQCAYGLTGATCASGSAFFGDWPSALAQASAANTAAYKGFSDWRVPNKNELESIVKRDVYSPAIDATAFPGTPTSAPFWTSTTYMPARVNAWVVGFDYGYTAAHYKNVNQYNYVFVRLVRSGQSFASHAAYYDLTPPNGTPAVVSTGTTHAGLSMTVDESGTGHWLLVPSGAAAPTTDQVVAGASYGAVTPVAAGNLALTANAAGTINLSGLTASTAYQLYFVAQDNLGNLRTPPSVSDFVTADAPITLSAPTVTTSPSTRTAGLSVTVSETGTGYWLLVPQGSAAPTAAQVAAGAAYGGITPVATGNLALTAGAAGNINLSGLGSNTAYTLYFAARDAANNLQARPTSVPVYTTASLTGLNDTGQTSCYNAANTAGACDAATTGNTGTRPHQDGRYGRDAAAAASQLTKTGGGAAGFDYSCVLWNGTVINGSNCTSGLVANTTGTASGSPATDWACTQDNTTGLVWSLQTQTATWATATGISYPNAGHNSATRCGHSIGWRVPTRRELLSLVHRGQSTGPHVDTTHLPGTATGSGYWTSDAARPEIAADAAWQVAFATGRSGTDSKTASNPVRLVRTAGTPSFDITAPTKTGESLNGLSVAGDTGTGTMTFSENVTVVSYRMITNGTAVLNTASAAGNVVTFTFDTGGSINVSNTIEVVVRDAAGNEATVQSATYITG